MELFRNILIPLDGTDNDRITVQKAIELYDPDSCIFHLLFIIRGYRVSGLFKIWNKHFFNGDGKIINEKAFAEKRLTEINSLVMAKFPQCQVIMNLIFSNRIFSNALTNYISQNMIDIIIVCNNKSRNVLSFLTEIQYDLIAKRTGCVLMKVTNGCLKHPIKSILLPVTNCVPIRKIRIAIEFAKRYQGHIYLVSFLGLNDSESKIKIDIFYDTYKLLRECGYTPHYKILMGEVSEQMLIEYACKVKADLVLLNPVSHDLIPFSSFFKRPEFELSPLSALHVMMLQPGNEILN